MSIIMKLVEMMNQGGGPSKFFVTGSKLKLKVQRLKCYIDTLTTNNYTNDKIDRNVKTYDLRD